MNRMHTKVKCPRLRLPFEPTIRHRSAARHREAGLAEVDSLALAAAAHLLERLLLAAQLAEAGLLAAQHGVLRVAQVPAQLQLVALCNNTAANGVNTQSSKSREVL